MAIGYIPLPKYNPGPQGIDFSPLSRGVQSLTEGIKENRLMAQQKDIGETIASGGYGEAADKSYGYGDIKTGTMLTQAEQADEDRDFNRNRLLAQDRRAAASDARSREIHGLNVQKTKGDIRDRLVKNVAGVAQMIRSEADPSRKAQMVQALINANPRMGEELSKLGLDPANPDAAMDMIIAEAQGLTQPKASEYKTFKPDQGIFRAGPQGMEIVREPQVGAGVGKPPSGYRYSQDGASLEAIPGGPATKLPGDMAGRMAALQTAKESFGKVREFYQGQGTMDRVNQLANRGKAGQVERNVSLAIEAALRAMTGAAAPESEVKNYLNIFGPSALDTPATIEDKLDRLQSFMANVEANIAQGRGETPGAAQPAAAETASPFPEYPNAQRAPDGNWYVEQNGQFYRIDQ